jgi:hypothetical protein
MRCRVAHGFEDEPCPLTADRDWAAVARGDPRAADRHARVCKRGGGPHKLHSLVRSQLARVLRDWGVPVKEEADDMLPGNKRMDLLLLGAGPDRALLAVDFTRRDGVSRDALAKAERDKEAKYVKVYQGQAHVRGFAFDEHGRIGPQAREVVDRLVAAGAQTCGAHPDDLRAELLATFGHALLTGLAQMYARAATINGDKSHGAPLESALVPAGQHRPVSGRAPRVPRAPRACAMAAGAPPRVAAALPPPPPPAGSAAVLGDAPLMLAHGEVCPLCAPESCSCCGPELYRYVPPRACDAASSEAGSAARSLEASDAALCAVAHPSSSRGGAAGVVPAA